MPEGAAQKLRQQWASIADCPQSARKNRGTCQFFTKTALRNCPHGNSYLSQGACRKTLLRSLLDKFFFVVVAGAAVDFAGVFQTTNDIDHFLLFLLDGRDFYRSQVFHLLGEHFAGTF